MKKERKTGRQKNWRTGDEARLSDELKCVCTAVRKTHKHKIPSVEGKVQWCGEGRGPARTSHRLMLRKHNALSKPLTLHHPHPGVSAVITYPPWECCCLVGWQTPHLRTQVASVGGRPLDLRSDDMRRCVRNIH